MLALLAAKSKVSRGTPLGPMTITVPPSFLTSLPVVTAAAIGRLPLGRVGQVDPGVAGDERELVLLQYRPEAAELLHPLDLPAEQLEALEAEARDVADDLDDGIRTGEPGRAAPGGIPPGPGDAGVPDLDVQLALRRRGQRCADEPKARRCVRRCDG